MYVQFWIYYVVLHECKTEKIIYVHSSPFRCMDAYNLSFGNTLFLMGTCFGIQKDGNFLGQNSTHALALFTHIALMTDELTTICHVSESYNQYLFRMASNNNCNIIACIALHRNGVVDVKLLCLVFISPDC